MPYQPLPRSFKRKYKKLHGRFSTIQSATNLLEENLNAVTATALKLIAENDMLLDLLAELGPQSTPVSVQEQLSSRNKDDQATLDSQTDVDELDDEYYAADIPAHFKSLPWDLDLQSFSGSHLEDMAQAMAMTAATAPAPILETPTMSNSARKIVKKRIRAEGEEDLNGNASKKKKK